MERIMTGLGKILCRAACAAAMLVSLQSCDGTAEPQVPGELTDGYWRMESDYTQLLHFSGSGHMFYYVCTPTGSDSFDACYDTSVQPHTRYAIDMPNGRICLLPDTWYDIAVLTVEAFTLGTDDGQSIKYAKVPSAAVRLLTEEEYHDLYPENGSQNADIR